MLPFLIGAAASVILSEYTKKDKMAIGGIVPTASNGEEFAEGGGFGSLKVNKESDGKYYWTYTFSDGKIEKSFQGFNTSAEAQRDFQYRSKYFAKGGEVKLTKDDIEILGVSRNKITEKEWESILRMAKLQSGATFILKDKKGLDIVPQVEYEWYVKDKYAKGGKVERVYIDYLNKEKNFKRDRKYFNSYEEAKKWALKNFEKFNSDMINYELAHGGSVKQVDLFEHFDKMPKKLSSIVNKYMDSEDYQDTEAFLNEVESIGYTFDYGLDNEPFALRPIGVKINDVEGYEEYKKGGKINLKKNK